MQMCLDSKWNYEVFYIFDENLIVEEFMDCELRLHEAFLHGRFHGVVFINDIRHAFFLSWFDVITHTLSWLIELKYCY